MLRNEETGELLQVVVDSGGKTARLQLRTPVSGKLRDVLEPLTDAAAIRSTVDGIHYAGSILVPFANRVANGTYRFFGTTHYLERNECSDVRCDALHGFLFNETLSVVHQEADAGGARLTLGFNFDGTSTPGWPFRAAVNVTYELCRACGPRGRVPSAPSATPGNGSATSALRITIRAVNTQTDGGALPWTASWHPYFRVSDVSKARVEFDSCGGGAWRHLLSGPGAPRKGDLIPTGRSEVWTTFDGKTALGGTRDKPTYYDDEFTSTLPDHFARPAACGLASAPLALADPIVNRIHDADGVSVALAGERAAFRTWQIFSGGKEGWGWDAIAMEPMSGLADAFNNGAGLAVVQAGEAWEGSFAVVLEEAAH